MNRKLAIAASLLLACGYPAVSGFEVIAQTSQTQLTVTGTLTDETGEPIVGAVVENKTTKTKVLTDIDGNYAIKAAPGEVLSFSSLGMITTDKKVSGNKLNVILTHTANALDEVVVTALGIKKDRKSLGYAIDEIDAAELARNKTANPLSSLSGKVAGVNITQAGGAAGSGAQITLRGGTSLERDNQPIFVVDGVIYDNSTNVVGNSAFDGQSSTSSTRSNRLMDINPEDIESMSVLKGPAAAALYGSRAAAGVVIITTKKGGEGNTEVSLSTKYISQWATRLPETQRKYGRGYYSDVTSSGALTGSNFDDFSYNSWGQPLFDGSKWGAKAADTRTYDNIEDFFQGGGAWDTNVSVAGGSKNGSFYLSASYYDQTGIIPNTGYDKTTVRYNGEQRWKMFTFNANAAYSIANTDRTLTSSSLYGSSGTGTMYGVYTWAPTDNMSHYINEDGTRYQMFGDRLQPWDERCNPNWIINKDKLTDQTERFTGTVNIKADITPWWWVQARVGIDSYTTDNSNTIAPGGVYKQAWQKGMYSENSYRYRYFSTNFMSNVNQQVGAFDFNLLLGLTTDDTRTWSNYRMAWNFEVPDFFSFSNTTDSNRRFSSSRSHKRLVGLFGEFRADWANTVFLTVTGRNDWSSTLPIENRSYFYPSVGGAIVFTQFLQDRGIIGNNILSFGKIRASWARVGKDTSPYQLQTALWASQWFLGDKTGVSDYWQSGNAYLKPEITESTEVGLELNFFNSRLKFDYAFYTNNSYNQIMSPRLSNATGYILRMVNAGDIYNKGMELSIGGIPVQNKDFQWETNINLAGNRGTVKNLLEGVDLLYVTDVQVGNAKAASFPDGNFMAISGSKWSRVEAGPEGENKEFEGMLILDKNFMPVKNANTQLEIGNREPKFAGGWNNTLTYKNFTFNMLWEFRVGGHVYNGTQYVMTSAGTSMLSANRESITITGVQPDGDTYKEVSQTFNADGVYQFNGAEVSGRTIIQEYYTNYYLHESANFQKKVNALRMRSISLSYALPKSLLDRTNFIKSCVFTASAANLLLFTNYDGDPEVAAAGSGITGSSSVGIDYCCVPSVASFAFGVNVTF